MSEAENDKEHTEEQGSDAAWPGIGVSPGAGPGFGGRVRQSAEALDPNRDSQTPSWMPKEREGLLGARGWLAVGGLVGLAVVVVLVAAKLL